MSEKTNADTVEDDKSDLDLIEEALVGTHQEVPRADIEDDGTGGSNDAGPPVPAHRSP